MNENFDKIYEDVEETTSDNAGVLSNDLSDGLDGSDDITTGGTPETTVSGGDAGTNLIPGVYLVDGTDRVFYLSVASEDSETELVEDTTETEIVYSTDTLAVLERIDYKLSIILFLLLFFWCAQKVKNAVRGFTGRGIDD